MSHELDRQIAQQVMNEETQRFTADDACPSVPAYSTDLNACAQAEKRVMELGLRKAYGEALILETGCSVMNDDECSYEYQTDYAECADLATTSAEVRCRAMLSVMEQRKGEP